MAGTLAPWIESGQVMVLSIDTMDAESWSDKGGRPPYWRIRRYEQWLDYIVGQAGPMLQRIACEKNGWDSLPGIIPFGCSLGATHAVNLYLRHPDLFDGCPGPQAASIPPAMASGIIWTMWSTAIRRWIIWPTSPPITPSWTTTGPRKR